MRRSRAVYRVTWSRREAEWWVRLPTGAASRHGTRADAVGHGRELARWDWDHGKLAQLVVHRRDGKIAFERTYGRDPRRRRG